MSLKWKHHLLFRKTMIPWYDKTPLCWFMVMGMIGIFVFALAGIDPALETAPDCLWVPLVLAGLSLFLIVKIFIRLKQRTESVSREKE